MKTIYISGPMTGIPDLNFPAFYAAQEMLESKGYRVINPAEIGKTLTIPDGLTEKQVHLFYVREDIKAMINEGCTVIYLLKGWESSEGAWMEVAVARMLQFEVLYELSESDQDSIQLCPSCTDGTTFVFHNNGPDYRTHTQGFELCSMCHGAKTVLGERIVWRRKGEILRKLRLKLNMTLSDIRIFYGFNLVEFSSAENGRIDPHEFINKLEES